MVITKFLELIALICLLSFASFAQAAEVIHYPRPESTKDSRTEYPAKLLKLALQNTEGQYTVSSSTKVMLQMRALKDLENNVGNVQIVWSMTSKEREERLLPIRIPIYKGLIGWRLPLVRKQNVELFSNIKTIDNLTRLVAGQGHDWPDTQILRFNELKVIAAPNYEGLFKMLELGRFQYFPRSVAEIWAEAKKHSNQELVIDKHIALHYQAAFYYFVNKDNKALAKALTTGLEKSIADGSFEKLFRKYHTSLLSRANLKNRTVIKLKNPLLPPETPLERKELWYKPK